MTATLIAVEAVVVVMVAVVVVVAMMTVRAMDVMTLMAAVVVVVAVATTATTTAIVELIAMPVLSRRTALAVAMIGALTIDALLAGTTTATMPVRNRPRRMLSLRLPVSLANHMEVLATTGTEQDR